MTPKFGRSWLAFFLTFGALSAWPCFSETPLATMSRCAATASPSLAGIKRLSEVCPDLPQAMDALGIDKMLYEGWRDKLSTHALSDAILLSERYSGAGWHRAPVGTAGVAQIVQALKDEQTPPAVTWWRSFKNWFKQWLAHSDSALAKWINHLFDSLSGTAHVPTSVWRVLVYTVTLLAALVAIYVIVSELKVAGIAARITRMRARKNPAGGSTRQPQPDSAAADDEDTPAGLLRMLVRRLLQTGRLTTERSLTHGELIVRAAFDDDVQRNIFAGVARAAEAMVYGSQSSGPDHAQPITRQGRELLQQLSATDRVT